MDVVPLDMPDPRTDMTLAPSDLATLGVPTVISVTPSSAVKNAITVLTVKGTNFRVGATVLVGGVACTQVAVVSPTQATT